MIQAVETLPNIKHIHGIQRLNAVVKTLIKPCTFHTMQVLNGGWHIWYIMEGTGWGDYQHRTLITVPKATGIH